MQAYHDQIESTSKFLKEGFRDDVLTKNLKELANPLTPTKSSLSNSNPITPPSRVLPRYFRRAIKKGSVKRIDKAITVALRSGWSLEELIDKSEQTPTEALKR